MAPRPVRDKAISPLAVTDASEAKLPFLLTIFLIDDVITRIDHSHILVISKKADEMTKKYKDFLSNISKRDKIPVEYLSVENYNNPPFSQGNKCRFVNEVMEVKI